MRRREFIAALGGGVAWPHAARGQSASGTRRIAIVMPLLARADEVIE